MQKERYELSSVQKNIWMLENFYKGSPINNLTGYVVFNEIIEYDLMIKALNLYLKENPIVRTKIITKENDIYQEVQDFESVVPKVLDFKKYTDEKIDAYINEYAEKPLEIDKNMFEFNIIYISDIKTIVLVKFHHLVADAWSFISLFMNEMVEYYYKFQANEEIVLNKENCGYDILLKREKEYKESAKYMLDKEFWSEEMDGLEAYSVMKNSNIKYSHKAKRLTKIIAKKDYEKIVKYCKENKVSEYVVFLAALAIYLYRTQLSENDITIGTPILNRLTKFEKSAAGMFISTIPLRFNIDENEMFLDVCKNISAKMFSVYRHQKYPFNEIAEEVYSKNNDIKKLYDVMISYQNAKFADIVKEKKIKRVWPFQNFQQEQFIMHITNYETTSKLEIFYDYLIDLFNEKEVNYIHNRLLNLIINGIEEDKEIKKLPIITDAEKELILDVFNNTDEEYPKDDNIVSIFEKQVKKQGDKVAVKYIDEEITYKELSKKVNILAKKLRQIGVEKDEVVGIKIDRGINQIISLLAVLKAGGVYMPIHPDWPEERVLYMIEDSKPKAIITEEIYMDMFTVVNECNFNILANDVVIDVNKYLAENTEDVKVNTKIDPEDLAYIIYTSGTTGRPKGTLITHRNVVRLFITKNYPLNFKETDIWTMFHTYTFDFSVWEMYGALLLGGTLVIVPEDTAKDAKLYLELLKKEKITIQNQTPSYFYKIVENEMLEKDARLKLRYVMVGGEAFHPINVKEFQEKYKTTKIVTVYGITETTAITTQKSLTKKEIELDEANIGKQLPTRKVYILDKNLELMPIGVEGELCEAGLGVCNGYLNNKEMTDKKFVKNPYGEGNIYKSGDVAKYIFNGDLIYVGRNDSQVKIRGFRIEIEEVEKLLLKIQGVKKVIVFAHENKEQTKTLYAFIVPNKNIVLDVNVIKNKLLEDIPVYMLPLVYIVDDFPVNTNGKADKRKLIEYVNTIIETKKQNSVKPTTVLEKKVLKIFTEESNGRINGILDNFYENNMDSLQILKVALELSKQNINISAQDIYDARDVKTLCYNIENDNTTVDEKIVELSKEEAIAKLDIKSEKFNLEKVFLTGATGFLGVHILNDLLKNKDTKKIYCMMRNKNGVDADNRLKETYLKYFDDAKYIKEYDKKVEIVKGDFLKQGLGISEDSYKNLEKNITSIINAAADVKHYGRYEDFYKTNVESVENLLELVRKSNASFAHISTESVGGYNKADDVITYDENSFDMGQTFFDNVYITTKFEAEKQIVKFKEKNKQSNIKIFRLGNIMPRYKDGKFQINYTQNAFIQKIKGIVKIEIVPDLLVQSITEISPVDICSKAIVTLLKHDDNMSIYNISNTNILVKDIVDTLNELNISIKQCSLEEFKEKIVNIREDYIAILQEQFNQLGYALNIIDNQKTVDRLNELGIVWPKLDTNYMRYILEIVNKK